MDGALLDTPSPMGALDSLSPLGTSFSPPLPSSPGRDVCGRGVVELGLGVCSIPSPRCRTQGHPGGTWGCPEGRGAWLQLPKPEASVWDWAFLTVQAQPLSTPPSLVPAAPLHFSPCACHHLGPSLLPTLCRLQGQGSSLCGSLQVPSHCRCLRKTG